MKTTEETDIQDTSERPFAATVGSALWTTGEIISAGLGKLCCPMDRVYVIMNYLTGSNLFTHQLPGAFRACKEWVLKQHPWLATLDEEKCTTENWREWLADAEGKVGTHHALQPMCGGTSASAEGSGTE